MSRRASRAIVVYDLHPHVAIFRELAGYKNIIIEEINDEDNSDYLRSLEPNEWKTNDHYAVLNLKNQRYKASDEAIRKQCGSWNNVDLFALKFVFKPDLFSLY